MIYSNADAEIGYMKNQIAFLTIQLMDERSRNQIWSAMHKSVQANPSLQTAWTDFLMILKLVDPNLVEQIIRLIPTHESEHAGS